MKSICKYKRAVFPPPQKITIIILPSLSNDNTFLLIHSFFMMSDNSHVIRRERKKRKANCFILYRTELLKHRPENIRMTDFSRVVSVMWKCLDDDRKDIYRRKYEINVHNSEKDSNEPLLPENSFKNILHFD